MILLQNVEKGHTKASCEYVLSICGCINQIVIIQVLRLDMIASKGCIRWKDDSE